MFIVCTVEQMFWIVINMFKQNLMIAVLIRSFEYKMRKAELL